MICALWVKGNRTTEGGLVFFERVIALLWDDSRPDPTLTGYFSGVLGGRTFTRYTSNPSWELNEISWNEYPTFYLKDCKGINTKTPFDCINGNCLPKETYNTPGFFPNLAACQNGCAKNSDCAGECIDLAEIAALRQAANILEAKYCQ